MGKRAGLKKRGNLFYSALLLTLGSVALRLVQMIFQVYISGVMGAAGLGRLQLLLTVGNFAAILASGGVRIAATCLAAEEAGMGRISGVRTAIRCCFLYGIALSSLAAAGLFLASPLLSRWWIEDATAAGPLKILAVFLPVNCVWAVLAGYFTAAGRVTELVCQELVERIGSIGLVVVLLGTGLGRQDPCAAVFLGSSIATTLCTLYLLLRYAHAIGSVPLLPMKPMMVRLLRLTVPLGLNDILRSGLTTLEHLLVPRGLQSGGEDHETAIAQYGTVCGMVFPVITFPSVILYSISDLLVPEMAKGRARRNSQRIIALTDRCLRLTVLFALGTAGICFLLGEELGLFLFKSREAGVYIRIYAPLIPILYADAITDGILKGLSQQVHSVRYNTLTSLLDVGLLVLLLPRCGLGGFLAAYTVSHALNFFLSIRRLLVVTGFLPRFRTTVRSAFCCAVSLLVMNFWPGGGDLGWVLLRGSGFLLLYILLTRLTGAIDREDTAWLRHLILLTDTP